MNNFDIKLNELVEVIKDQDEVKRYLAIELELAENEFVKNKIEKFKKFQKKLAIYENKNNQIPKDARKEYDKLYQELLDIPIFNEYITLQEEINGVVKQITEIIELEINK